MTLLGLPQQEPSVLSPDERSPMMVDDLMFLGWQSIGPLRHGLKTRLKDGLRTSRKFVLDHKAWDTASWLLDEHPELIGQYSEFAQAPFPKTWIEVPGHKPPGETTSVRRGFLLLGNEMYSFLEMIDKEEYGDGLTAIRNVLVPITATLHRPMPMSEQLALCELGGISRLGIDELMWGKGVYEDMPVKYRKTLREHHSLGLTMPMKNALHEKNAELAQKMFHGLQLGDLADVLSILMLLMRPSHTKVIRDEPKERRQLGDRMKTFFAHNVVTVNLESKPLVKRISNSIRRESLLRRRHEVRGHYCHNREARETTSHAHYWEQTSDTQWECAYPHCDAKRWWKKAHERGSAEIGYVTKHYKVTDSRQ